MACGGQTVVKTDGSSKWSFHATDKVGEKILIRGMILSFFIPAFCIFGIMMGLFSDFMEMFQSEFRFAPLVEAVIIFLPSLWICSTYTKTVRQQVMQLFRFEIVNETLFIKGENVEKVEIGRKDVKNVELERRAQGNKAMCKLMIKTKQKEKFAFHVRLPIAEVKRGNKDYQELIKGFHHLLDWTGINREKN